MVVLSRSASARRAGSAFGLLALQVGAVVALHQLGRVPALRIPWRHPEALPGWLATSPVEQVAGALGRTAGLLVAWWLLARTAWRLAAGLRRVPDAVLAVRWSALPGVRGLADRLDAVLAVGWVAAARRAAALPALLALEVGTVAGLHRLGRIPALQVPWSGLGRGLGTWLLHSPVEDVLGGLGRLVALFVAYWLLGSTVLYLLAAASRIP